MKIILSPAEIMQASMVGVMRRLEGVKYKRSHKHGMDDDFAWTADIEGALGECALAKFLGAYWCGTGTLGACDVGNVDARTTRYATGKLPITKDDDDNRKIYLVTGQYGVYDIRGWVYAREGKQDKYWAELAKGRWNYFVPQSDLKAP